MFLYVSHFLTDVFKSLGILCKVFQASSIDFTGISASLESTASEVRRLTRQDVEDLQNICSRCC